MWRRSGGSLGKWKDGLTSGGERVDKGTNSSGPGGPAGASHRPLPASLRPPPPRPSLSPSSRGLLLPTLTAPLSFFARDCALGAGWAQAVCRLTRSRSQIPDQPRALQDHAVQQLEKMPSLSRGAQGVRPGLSSPRAPALARVTGQRHQEAWAPGTEEDGSVTRKDGSGWARTVSRDSLKGAGVQANGLPEGAWRWGGSDQEHQYCSRWGSHLGITRFPGCA